MPQAQTGADLSLSCLAEITEIISTSQSLTAPDLVMDAEQCSDVKVAMNDPMSPDKHQALFSV